MGLFDFFKKSGDADKAALVKQPLGYWEESSYMQLVPPSDGYMLDEGILDRVGGIEGLDVKSFAMPATGSEGELLLDYGGEEYKVSFFWASFELPQMYRHNNQFFTEKEMQALKRVKKALVFHMKFGSEPKKSYHLQLKLACAMMPDLMGLIDESAEKLLCPRCVKMAARSYVLPANDSLYTVQAISAKNGEVWLHTHGLARCGITELEILCSDKENYNNHYYIISALAGRYLDGSVKEGEPVLIGRFSNNDPIVVTAVIWTEALGRYKANVSGGAADRRDGHNSETSIVFMCEENGLLSPVTDYNKILADNPLFFISSEETQRMSMLARERFEYVKTAAENDIGEKQIIIKIGLPTASGETPEHIWFELESFNGDKFSAILTQEPYDVPDMHTGDRGEYTVDDVTDWMIFSKKYGRIVPETAYLLE